MFVVCHMLTSLDGKIDGAFFGAAETAPALHAYGELRGYYNCPATLYGTTTMLGGYADGLAPSLEQGEAVSAREDYVNAAGLDVGNFIVSVDPLGTLGFHSHCIEKKGRPAAHVIEALTAQASPAYLAYLRRLGISYVFAGDKLLNCALLLQKLQSLFDIGRLLVAGGGTVTWSFAQEGLIDELSVVVAPVADGGTESVSIFERAAFMPAHAPVAFSLHGAKALDGNALWLRYVRK